MVGKSLTVDNAFVFVVLFSTLRLPREYQHRLVFYGVLGAIVMRTILIFSGAALVERFQWILDVFGVQFEWILYICGVFLLYVAVKTWQNRNKAVSLFFSSSELMKRSGESSRSLTATARSVSSSANMASCS
jgi:predicted tellurium resistance membrane protein TerC